MMENERENNLAKPKKENLGLKVTLGVLGVCILGLVGGIIVINLVNNNVANEDIIPAPPKPSAEDIIENWQLQIDRASSDDEKADLYVRLAYLLSDYMRDTGEDQCLQIQNNAEKAIALSPDSVVANAAKAVILVCDSQYNNVVEEILVMGDSEDE